MQIRVTATPPSAFDLASLQAALPQAYKATQAPPIVPQAAYNAAFGTAYTVILFASNTDQSMNLTGTPRPWQGYHDHRGLRLYHPPARELHHRRRQWFRGRGNGLP